MFITGTVLDGGVSENSGANPVHSFRVQVDEAFVGLPGNTKQVVVATEGSWLQKGHSYLFDAVWGNDGRLYPVMCGATEETKEEDAVKFLEYLRQRANGKTKTWLSVDVRDHYQPVEGVEVRVDGPGGSLKTRTTANGAATFEDIKPGKYRVSASGTHYRIEKDSGFNQEVSVVAGACASSYVSVVADAEVSGLMRDAQGAPVASLELELVTAPENPTAEISLNRPFFHATTGEDGRFLFAGVSPGRYLLGSNIIGLHSSTVPPTFYPGQRSWNGAVPIEVKLGETAGNLVFVLPDFGGFRDIRVCVIDEKGAPVPSASVGPARKRDDTARLGEKLTTDETGCVTARGYIGVEYAVKAFFRPAGGGIRETHFSESVVIPAGDQPVVKVLKLGKPLGWPKFKQ